MREGSLEAPTRHIIDWQNPEYFDAEKLDAEMRRQFDICHGCRRCFNLCESFPRLFDMVDEAGDAEVHGLKSEDFGKVVDACTLCDMCFMTKCPYVPPHEFNIDFPHLMLRYRAAERKKRGGTPFFEKQLTETDRNGKLAAAAPGLANWASDRRNKLTRPLLEKVAGVDRAAELPKFHGKTFTARARDAMPAVNQDAPAYGRKAAIFATCFANYNNPHIGEAALAVLARNGVQADVVYPGCCGMPQLEQGDIARVAEKAKATALAFKPHIEAGKDVIALIPSCALMMKFEWPLIVPGDPDVKALSQATYDISEYIVDIADKEGLAPGMKPVGGVALHLACHARAQNMGAMGAEMLRVIPDTDVSVIERCSGHGGSWGIMKGHFEIATKFARQTVRRVADANKTFVASECPLAGKHLAQGLESLDGAAPKEPRALHPIEILAKAYGIEP